MTEQTKEVHETTDPVNVEEDPPAGDIIDEEQDMSPETGWGSTFSSQSSDSTVRPSQTTTRPPTIRASQVNKPTIGDQIVGKLEEFAGRITRNPELIERGIGKLSGGEKKPGPKENGTTKGA